MELYLNVRKFLVNIEVRRWNSTNIGSSPSFTRNMSLKKKFKIKSLKSVFERLSTFCVHRSIFFLCNRFFCNLLSKHGLHEI